MPLDASTESSKGNSSQLWSASLCALAPCVLTSPRKQAPLTQFFTCRNRHKSQSCRAGSHTWASGSQSHTEPRQHTPGHLWSGSPLPSPVLGDHGEVGLVKPGGLKPQLHYLPPHLPTSCLSTGEHSAVCQVVLC